MRIDDSRERRLVGLGADIAVGDPNQLVTGDALAGRSHAANYHPSYYGHLFRSGRPRH